jgi:hypothetical protein
MRGFLLLGLDLGEYQSHALRVTNAQIDQRPEGVPRQLFLKI